LPFAIYNKRLLIIFFVSTIYTKTGDTGDTSLGKGGRVKKDDLRVELLGEIDEISSLLGIAVASGVSKEVLNGLRTLQKELYEVNSCVSGCAEFDFFASIKRLEGAIDSMCEKLPKITSFIAYSGTLAATQLFLARAVCRRAERRLVLVSRKHKEFSPLIPYINRLSDYLFTLARFVNFEAGISDVPVTETSV
jgi:cob(I)alamin adenosyltransferase